MASFTLLVFSLGYHTREHLHLNIPMESYYSYPYAIDQGPCQTQKHPDAHCAWAEKLHLFIFVEQLPTGAFPISDRIKLMVNANGPNEIESASRSSRVNVDFATARRESTVNGRIRVAGSRIGAKVEKYIS